MLQGERTFLFSENKLKISSWYKRVYWRRKPSKSWKNLHGCKNKQQPWVRDQEAEKSAEKSVWQQFFLERAVCISVCCPFKSR